MLNSLPSLFSDRLYSSMEVPKKAATILATHKQSCEHIFVRCGLYFESKKSPKWRGVVAQVVSLNSRRRRANLGDHKERERGRLTVRVRQRSSYPKIWRGRETPKKFQQTIPGWTPYNYVIAATVVRNSRTGMTAKA